MTKFSKETRVKLAGLHQKIKDCCTKLDALGYKDAEEDEGAGKAAKSAKAFGYGEPAKKAVASPTKTLRETLNKLDIPSTKKVK